MSRSWARARVMAVSWAWAKGAVISGRSMRTEGWHSTKGGAIRPASLGVPVCVVAGCYVLVRCGLEVCGLELGRPNGRP